MRAERLANAELAPSQADAERLQRERRRDRGDQRQRREAHRERRVDAQRVQASPLRADLEALWSAHNRSGEPRRTIVDAEYLEVVATRA